MRSLRVIQQQQENWWRAWLVLQLASSGHLECRRNILTGRAVTGWKEGYEFYREPNLQLTRIQSHTRLDGR